MERSPEAHVSLAPLTTWRIGGCAEWFISPETEAELMQALEWARARRLPIHLLGRGSNTLIHDDGLAGLVICLRSFGKDSFSQIEMAKGPELLEVAAGMSLPRLSKVAARAGFRGYEFYIGIPGTVGGAIAVNAGFGPGDERQTANRCREIRILEPGKAPDWVPYEHFRPVYRHTALLDSGIIVLGARFILEERATPEEIRAVTAEHLSMRRTRQPLTRPTAGSVFKGTEKGIPAAVYIDRCGLKGMRIGDAVVSLKHANWIENMGSASAQDVLALIERVQATVLRMEGVRLEPEVRLMQ